MARGSTLAASDRIREHRDRQERLEDLAVEARAILSQRRADLDDVETIAAYAQDMSEFLKESELKMDSMGLLVRRCTQCSLG